jgi:multidrug efflux pump subunit AcrA (membrane-fusion protein)
MRTRNVPFAIMWVLIGGVAVAAVAMLVLPALMFRSQPSAPAPDRTADVLLSDLAIANTDQTITGTVEAAGATLVELAPVDDGTTVLVEIDENPGGPACYRYELRPQQMPAYEEVSCP